MRRLLALMTALVVVFAGSATVTRSADAIVPGAVGRIVFLSDRDHLAGEIYTRDFAGGVWTRLTSNTSNEWEPLWSPDGSEIAFVSNAAGPFDVWVMVADGSNQRNITNDASNSFNAGWSPDGTKIVYASAAGSSSDVWVMDADGSDKTKLTSFVAGSYSYDPAWSPDGTSVAFSSDRDGLEDVFVMSANGNTVTNITKSATTVDADPCWSPDGSRIAYTSVIAGGGSGTLDVWVMDADGSNKLKLTASTGGTDSYAPRWSPDGLHILFTSNADGDDDLWMVDPDGSSLGHLTDHPGNEWEGAWESVNRPPVAVDDTAMVQKGGSVTIGVLANDSDPDGEPLRLNTIVTPPKHGAITNKWVTSFVYQHDGSAAMSDSFTYRAQDTRSGVSNVATVTIKVGVPDTVGLVDPGSGVWRLRNSAGVVSSFFFGDPGDYPFVGDWDCDGDDTPGLYRQSDGFAYLRNANSQGVADVSFFFGDPGDVPLAGDFDGDGCDTLSVYRPSEQRFYIINTLGTSGGGLGAADYWFLFGDPGDRPVVGDWDGDGVDEVGLHRESTGFFYYRDTLSTGVADGEFFFGDPGDRFVAGDFGVVDGRDTPGLFRPSNVTFYFRHTLTQGNADAHFAWTGAGTDWLPVAGDFDLD